MTSATSVDSRQYRFGFVLGSAEELPADFGTVSARRDFISGLFLPRDDTGWFDHPRYPPRILALYPDSVEIHTHRAYDEAPTRISLSDLHFVEFGHMLLHGWFRFVGASCNRTLLYNTRSRPSVDSFLSSFRDAFVPPRTGTASCENRFGETLDLKFRYARLSELADGEHVVCQFFQQARRNLKALGPFKREFWSPADLLAISDRRLLWITDRYRDRYERYGTVTTYTPPDSIAGWACDRGEAGLQITAMLRSGAVWRVPIMAEHEAQARAFVENAESR